MGEEEIDARLRVKLKWNPTPFFNITEEWFPGVADAVVMEGLRRLRDSGEAGISYGRGWYKV